MFALGKMPAPPLPTAHSAAACLPAPQACPQIYPLFPACLPAATNQPTDKPNSPLCPGCRDLGLEPHFLGEGIMDSLLQFAVEVGAACFHACLSSVGERGREGGGCAGEWVGAHFLGEGIVDSLLQFAVEVGECARSGCWPCAPGAADADAACRPSPPRRTEPHSSQAKGGCAKLIDPNCLPVLPPPTCTACTACSTRTE